MDADDIVIYLRSVGKPVTRKNYLSAAFGDRDYEPTPEEESMIPDPLSLID